MEILRDSQDVKMSRCSEWSRRARRASIGCNWGQSSEREQLSVKDFRIEPGGFHQWLSDDDFLDEDGWGIQELIHVEDEPVPGALVPDAEVVGVVNKMQL
jgi:hypothetical protein